MSNKIRHLFVRIIPNRVLLNIILCFFLGNLFALNAAAIITNTSLAIPNCLHYQTKGTCFWLNSGETVTTAYVSHYVPDVVVSVFEKNGDNSWTEANLLIDTPANIAEQGMIKARSKDNAGFGQQTFIQTNEQSIYFFEADVVGNPGLTLLQNPLLLKPIAQPMQPYYVSSLDSLLWRGFLPESLPEETYALTDTINHVGTGLINWGGVFPHAGKVVSTNSEKAASVVAMRAIDLLTDSINFGHIKKALSTNCGIECKANRFTANNQNTLFQMVYPNPSNECAPLGEEITTGDNTLNQSTHAYVWIVWRQYQGCLPGPGQFLYKITS